MPREERTLEWKQREVWVSVLFPSSTGAMLVLLPTVQLTLVRYSSLHAKLVYICVILCVCLGRGGKWGGLFFSLTFWGIVWRDMDSSNSCIWASLWTLAIPFQFFDYPSFSFHHIYTRCLSLMPVFFSLLLHWVFLPHTVFLFFLPLQFILPLPRWGEWTAWVSKGGTLFSIFFPVTLQ